MVEIIYLVIVAVWVIIMVSSSKKKKAYQKAKAQSRQKQTSPNFNAAQGYAAQDYAAQRSVAQESTAEGGVAGTQGTTYVPYDSVNTRSGGAGRGNGGMQLKRKYKENAARQEANFRRMEDRQNDWLARQIREEANWRRNSCFDPAAELKNEHASDCDADKLRKGHAKTHRSGRI